MRRAVRWLVAIVPVLAVVAAGAGVALVVAHRNLPELVAALVHRALPGLEFTVSGARPYGVDGIDLRRVTVRVPGEPNPILIAKRLQVRWSLRGLRAGHLDELRVDAPLFTLPEALPDVGGGDGGEGGGWTLGRLVLHDGRFRSRATGDRPGLSFDFGVDLRDLGITPALADQPHRLRVRTVRMTVPNGPRLAARDALATFTLANLFERRTLDELRLMAPVVRAAFTAPETATSESAVAPDAGGLMIGRLVTHDGRVIVPPAGEQPGVKLDIAFDMREVGLDPTRAARLQRLRIRNVRVAWADAEPSLIVDAAHAEFTLAGLLEQHRLEVVHIDRGTLIVDRAFRARLEGEPGPKPAPSATPWRLGVLEIAQLGVRLAEVGRDMPDITLNIHTALREVPLDASALALAHDPQRIELADLTLYSPLDPFRQVIHVGSIFVDCSLAGLVEQEIDALTLLSPTIYLGEDLVWYMDASRDESATATAQSAWLVRRMQADLGRIMLTFNGLDRLVLPVTFKTHASNITLRQLATLRLAAQLSVPRQSYRFPNFDLDLVDLRGDLRFDYPPGQPEENVVNVLQVDEIRWKDYRLDHGWLSLTFDEQGISARLGGDAYAGYLTAGVSIPFGAERPWDGWVSGSHLDLAQIATAVAKSGVSAEGTASVKGTLALRNNRIESAQGLLTMDSPGHLSIPALDALLERLPATASSWQRDLARIAVDAFRDYPYTSGDGTLEYADFRGRAALALAGPRGGRRVELHYYEDAPLTVQVAKEEK